MIFSEPLAVVRRFCTAGWQRMMNCFGWGAGTALAAAVLVALSTLAFAVIAEEGLTERIQAVALINASGTALGAMTIWIAWTFLFGWRSRSMAALFAMAATVFTGGVIFAAHLLAFIGHHAEWHAPVLSRIWVFQMIYTTASALAIFLTRGIWYVLLFGWIAPILAAWSLQRASASNQHRYRSH